MIIFLAALALLCLYGISLPVFKSKKPADSSTLYPDYLSVEKCNSVKGIFIIIVFLSHASHNLTLSSSLFDKSFDILIGVIIGQSMVSLFLFYSGFGVMYSVDKKGGDYIRSIPSKRFLKVLLHFDIAVILFGVLQFFLGRTFTPAEYLLSLTGWESLGNSNWYIFVILCLYLITFLAFTLARRNRALGFALCAVFSAVLVVILCLTKSDRFWFDTIMCYPLGMGYYLCKDKIEGFLHKNKGNWYLAVVVAAILFGGSFVLRRYLIFEIFRHIFFALTVVLLTMKISIHNKVLQFFGKHLFSIYILQRLPMITLTYYGITNKYLYVIISFAVTILLAIPFDFLLGKLDNVIFGKSQKKISPPQA